MPFPMFPEMILRAPAVVPPIVVFKAPLSTPSPLLPIGFAPLTSRPMMFPWINAEEPVDGLNAIEIPSPTFPEMRLKVPTAVPPIVSPIVVTRAKLWTPAPRSRAINPLLSTPT